MSDELDSERPPQGKGEETVPTKGWSTWSLEKKLSIVIIPILVALIGAGIPLFASVFGDNNSTPSPGPTAGPQEPPPAKHQVPRFSGVVGNFEQSRAFLTFLEDNDGDPVQLEEVGFNEATFDDFIGDPGNVRYVQVWTECDPAVADEVDPDFGMGCLATSFEVDGPETADTDTYLQHGVPMYDGFFRVDVSGNLQNGVSPIYLEPLTREAATTE